MPGASSTSAMERVRLVRMSTQSEPMLDGMVALVAVVTRGGFTPAAASLGLQKGTVSRRVQALEQHLGVQLLHRTTRRSRLTEIGTEFYQRALKIVDAAREAEAVARASSGQVAGVLRVCMPEMLAELLAQSVFVPFMRAHPDMSLSVEFATRPVEPVRDGYDLVIRPGELGDLSNPSVVRSRQLPGGPVVLVGAPDYLRRSGRPLYPRDLSAHAAVVATVGASHEWPLYGPRGPLSTSPRVRLRTQSSRLALRAVLAGVGLGAFPKFFVRAPLATGRLETLLDNWLSKRPSMVAMYPRDTRAVPGLKPFADLLVRVLTSVSAGSPQ